MEDCVNCQINLLVKYRQKKPNTTLYACIYTHTWFSTCWLV